MLITEQLAELCNRFHGIPTSGDVHFDPLVIVIGVEFPFDGKLASAFLVAVSKEVALLVNKVVVIRRNKKTLVNLVFGVHQTDEVFQGDLGGIVLGFNFTELH
jgi:hypothetical protein